jgi:hypothetical protein
VIQQLHVNLRERLALHAATEPAVRAKGWIKPDMVLLGARYLEQQDAPPRVVIVPTQERLNAPSKRTRPDGTAIAKSRGTTFEAHLWGCDFTECELLLEALVSSLDAELNSQVEYGIGVYETSERPGWLTEGELLVLPFTLATPLRAVQAVYATIETVVDEGILVNPAG